MKQLKIAVMALFILVAVSNLTAQDSNNPWAIGFGINVVDINLDEYYETDTWNILPSISRISVEKYLDKGFTL